ncbi:MAG: TonB-dependent receptor [Myxococcota bacterium]
MVGSRGRWMVLAVLWSMPPAAMAQTPPEPDEAPPEAPPAEEDLPETPTPPPLPPVQPVLQPQPQPQSEPDPEPEEDDAFEDEPLEEIVVTAVARAGATAFQSSVSVSDLLPEEIEALAPRNTTEIFRSIPGVRSENSGGSNNANIQVRGIPVTTGGAKFIQLQEDGLPVLSFGDITFGNADNFLRADRTVGRIEAIRGGSASTFASNAPGAVINFISKTGEKQGGSISITRGIDFDTTRADFEYGGPIGQDLTFHVGGFYRLGEGPRQAGFLAENGGQLKANVTKKFDHGHVRLYLKHLDDRTISYLPAPVSLAGGEAAAIPGFDIRTQSLATQNLLSNTRVDATGLGRTDIRDGVRSLSTSIGSEFLFELPQQWTVTDRFRYSANRGGFVGSFAGGVLNAADVAKANGGTDLVYANGRRVGRTLTGLDTLNGNGLLIDNLLFDVKIPDLSQFVNDLNVRRTIETDSIGTFDVSVGYYKALQQIETEWSFNFYLQEARGDEPALVNVVNNGDPLSVNGVRQFGIFDPLFDLTFDRDAVYGALVWNLDWFTLDNSLRYENVRGTGASNLGSATGQVGGFVSQDLDVNGDGVIVPAETEIGTVDPGGLFDINTNVDYLSYSFGANIEANRDLALFARYSRGGSANGDRMVLGGTGFNRGGELIDSGIGVDVVRQAEAGLKYRSLDKLFPGYLGLFVTGFYADTEESNFEITSGRAIDRRSRATGVEFEGIYKHRGFSLLTGLTATDARIINDQLTPDNEGNRPRRQAALIYQVSPSYTRNRHAIGATVVGTTSSFAQDNNDLMLPAFAQVNAFIRANLADGLTASLNVNNLTNTFGLTEAEEGSLPDNGIVRARVINGRTTVGTLTYTF